MPIPVTIIMAVAFVTMCVLLILTKSENYKEASRMALDEEIENNNNTKNEE